METFTVHVQTMFEASHHLTSYKGKPEDFHQHSWKVEAKFQTHELDHEGIALDYIGAEKALRNLCNLFNHKDLNKISPFDKISPTSEHLARWFFQELDRPKIRQNSKLVEVIIWEGPLYCVAYSKNN